MFRKKGDTVATVCGFLVFWLQTGIAPFFVSSDCFDYKCFTVMFHR